MDRIVIDPAILCGKPVVRGTRLAVAFLVELLANGWSVEEVLDDYPDLTREDIQACLEYTSRTKGPRGVGRISPLRGA